ncbi:MAG: primosomal protein N' [Saprospiraceae bacterium]|nr:primosomal protein N' [Saprospiraceae bacterium]
MAKQFFADVIIPLAVRETYTYAVPTHMVERVCFGVRVEVAFGKKKLYAALVISVHERVPSYDAKDIISVLDDHPIIQPVQMRLWTWMSEYYLCGLGEIMHAALPSQLKLHSETLVTPGDKLDDEIFELDDRSQMIAEAVSIQKEISIDQIRSILNIKTVYPIIKLLLEKRVIEVKEVLNLSYKPKSVTAIRFGPTYADHRDKAELFDLLKRSDHQTRAMLALINLLKTRTKVTQAQLLQTADITHQVIAALEKKGLVERYTITVSRLGEAQEISANALSPLTSQQEEALKSCRAVDRPILIHGVTGSGKTRIYIELIRESLQDGKQVLYMLPEIALTTQLVTRLRKVFGNELLVYHSRLHEPERVEVWNQIQKRPAVVLGARSSIFLPFSDLGLIVVDEEHDGSYKQDDPNPRYQGRDAAVVLANLHESKIVLGSATPSVESYYNAIEGKYRLVEMPQRYGDIPLPEILIYDLKKGSRSGHFSRELLDEIESNKQAGYQVILFQNRRGFAPRMFCDNCGWSMVCKNCDTTLTYHQYSSDMRCHLCGYRQKPQLICPDCGNHELGLSGFGTEMIEDEVKIHFPDYKVGRLDLDTARGKKQLERILTKFENRELDILIGTQMVTKGLDFDAVALVSILNADQLLYYPDFRASERAFQLMTQVSGRAGRRKRRGRVLIQAYSVDHPVIKDVINHDYQSFFLREIAERKKFGFPPYCRLIQITMKHRSAVRSEQAAEFMVTYLTDRLGSARVKGPVKPGVARVRNRYINFLIVKLERKAPLMKQTKNWIREGTLYLTKQKGMSTLRAVVNIDP